MTSNARALRLQAGAASGSGSGGSGSAVSSNSVPFPVSETVEGISVSSDTKTWLATGVGPVQNQVVLNEDGNSTVAVQSQLTSFAAG